MHKQDFVFIGENLALDFINTQQMREGRELDTLPDYAALLEWLVAAKVLDAAQAKAAFKRWEKGAAGKRGHTQAQQLRAALRGMIENIVADKPVAQSSLDSTNEILQQGATYVQVVRKHGGFEKHAHTDRAKAVQLLVPIAEAAADLLCHGNLDLVKKCDNPRCILYFYDTTKNHARRWCSMAGCGNRMKAAAHYRRLHSA